MIFLLIFDTVGCVLRCHLVVHLCGEAPTQFDVLCIRKKESDIDLVNLLVKNLALRVYCFDFYVNIFNN